MNSRYIIVLLLVTSCSVFPKSKAGKYSEAPTLIEAYTQKVVGGTRNAPTEEMNRHVVLRWNAKVFPTAFFWRGETGWMPCKAEVAHRVDPRTAGVPAGVDYQTKRVNLDKVAAGDTLLLTVMSRGKYPVPDGITDDIKNRIYYEKQGSGLLFIQVPEFKTKQNIFMP